jgi:stage V sporulation protein AE
VLTVGVVVGCVLSGFKVYDIFIEKFMAGATVPIINFGHLLVSGASDGFKSGGFIGLFKGVFTNAGAGISIAILSGFIVSMIFKIRD